ncbi:MAG TPA: efflux RND transporter periplasmic adaptor subunit, partial [Rhodocyclaceae bacterium]
QADAALARALDLQRRSFVSAAAVDQAQAEADAARAARQAADAALSHAEIRAPFTGIVADRHADVGDLAAPGVPLLTVYRPGAARAVVQLPSAQAAAIRAVGAALRATIAIGGDAEPIAASRVQVLPVADAATHVVEVRLELPPDAARRAVPGSAVRATFAVGESASLALPAAAIVHRGGIAAAYVRDSEGRFRLRQLRLGEATADGEIEILAGLVAGEIVALDPVKAGIERRRAAER